MKWTQPFFFSIIALSAFLAMGLDGYGQGKNLEKSYSWKYNVNESMNFTFNNYDCDLTIHTWEKREIEYVLTVDATTRTEEDAGVLDSYLDGLEFSHSAGSVMIDNRFWSSMKSTRGKKTMTLKGGKTIQLVDIKIEGEIWMPVNSAFHLVSKYSEIEVGELNGKVDLDLYNDKIFGSNVNSTLKVVAKYSTLEFQQLKDIEADLYNTDVEARNIGNLVSVSKYSNFRVGDAGKVELNAYNDKYILGNTGDITFIDKYSDLHAGNAGHVTLDCYNSSVWFTKVEDVDLHSKYGRYEIAGARKLNIISAYNDTYRIEKLGSLNVSDSKYAVYKIDYLESSLLLKEGYSDKIQVAKTGAFKELNINGKYITLEMALDKGLSYKFVANVKFGKLDINEEAMNVRKMIKDGSQLEMEAVKGVEKEGMPAFFVNGYEIAVTLTEQL
jgi:hypothetical protein